MMRTFRQHRKKIRACTLIIFAIVIFLTGRLTYVAIFNSRQLSAAAKALHERERTIKAARGRIISRDGTVLANNETVCTVSVIHSQMKEPEKVIDILTDELGMSEEKVRYYVEKVSSRETVKTNVPKETGDRIREYHLDGVKVDEDSKRIYPYYSVASKILGFTGADNQGIVGLEVEYDELLAGSNGMILTMTDASGVELAEPETRIEPVPGNDLYLTLDYNIQSYCTQAAMKTYEAKKAKSVSIIVMNPQNGSIYAMVNYPEYNLNEPFTLDETGMSLIDEKEK
ncbi:MAG: peptidoglycan glycosyltransferase, partial [Butyrivibrio sp.]